MITPSSLPLYHPADCHPISGNDGIPYYTRRLNCISILHNGIVVLIPLCPCDNCCIVFYGPTALLEINILLTYLLNLFMLI